MTTPRCIQAPAGAAAKAAIAHRASVPVIETARLRLRAPEVGDFPAYATILSADEGHMGGPFSPEDIWYDFTNYIAGWMLHGIGLWTVTLNDDTVVGFITLGLEWEDQEPELGWLFLPEYHGQGYAAEAAHAARDLGLDLLQSFVSYVDPDNTRSNRLAERLGAARDPAAEASIATAQGEAIHVWRHGGAK